MKLTIAIQKVNADQDVSSSRGTQIFLDGEEITGVTDFELKANGPDGLWSLRLDLIVAFEGAEQPPEGYIGPITAELKDGHVELKHGSATL